MIYYKCNVIEAKYNNLSSENKGPRDFGKQNKFITFTVENQQIRRIHQ